MTQTSNTKPISDLKAIALLKILALGKQQLEAGKTRSVKSVIAGIRRSAE